MEESKLNMPLLGDDFPELKVQTTHGPMNIPGDMKGKWFVLFSHPADFTPVCTTEFVTFQKRCEEFEKLGCQLIGSNVIVPPATDEKTAGQRVKDYENFDWWFCHKPLEK